MRNYTQVARKVTKCATKCDNLVTWMDYSCIMVRYLTLCESTFTICMRYNMYLHIQMLANKILLDQGIDIE